MLIVKVPGINAFGKTKGCRNAGNAIIASLDEIWSNEKGKPIDRKLLDLEEIHVNNENLDEQDKLIYENSREIIEKQDRIIFLGGDHSISFSIGRAFLDFCRKENKEACLIVFDAHADCMIQGKEPTHEEWLIALIESGFNAENILLVGARNFWREEIEFLAKNKIKRVEMNEIRNNLEDAGDFITEFCSGKNKEVYISIDIDVLDPAFAPSTFYKEPGGMAARELIYILQRLMLLKPKAADIVEVDAEKDEKHENMTVKLAGKLLAEML